MTPNSKEHSFAAIYVFRNKVNGMVYVGATKNVYHRYKDYRCFCNSSSAPTRGIEFALRKWGIDTFDFDILEKVEVVEGLREREQYWIDELLPFGDKGYNWAKESGYGDQGPHTPWEGRSEFSRKVYREKVAAIWIKMASKPVYQIDKNTLKIIREYSSAAEATRDHKLPHRTVSSFCLGAQHRTGCKFYWAYKEKYDAGEFQPPTPQLKERAVRQLDDDNNTVNVWPNLHAAACAIKAPAPGIRRCCDGERQHCRGWRWQYVEKTWHRKNLPKVRRETPERRKIRLQKQSAQAIAQATIRPIIQSDRKGNVIKIWDGIRVAGKALGLDFTNIARCCYNKRPSAYGYVWSFVTDESVIAEIKTRRKLEYEQALSPISV